MVRPNKSNENLTRNAVIASPVIPVKRVITKKMLKEKLK